MKSYIVNAFGPPHSLALEERPAPETGDRDVVVEVKAIGLNFPDNLLIAGKYQKLPSCPFVPGMEFSGIVRSVGSSVTEFLPGDRVIAQPGIGAFAEQAVARPEALFKLDDGMSFEIASGMGLAYQTAYIALSERASFTPDDVVLVGGANGDVGYAALQIAKAMGAKVLAGVRSERAARIVHEAGADAVIDLSGDDLANSLREQVMAATDGHGADVVIDPVGGAFLGAAMRAMAWCGRLVVVGFAAGEIPNIKANYLLVKNIAVSGMQWTDYRDRRPEAVQEAHEALGALWAKGLLSPRIGSFAAFEDLPEALALNLAGKTEGRTVVRL
ncbi:NADPH:quinone oxidoreductase family protein [Novosphingobium mangrovi (ex Huang et al. 2023)]|uniref:NADPH:quinone oxidoreductase family protein n=1 Tax=Novosphingobium mangrovi (ex Huang et al. 2023) TaxID=2976432 RepID=A0ABT2I8Q9_9SPHN|nr:NADPH:quinone oxidoreductase family protein [Novosphingobium mangrovi (ex Huang et al. 2023)]MCT2401197.1 NADPH:quinone oxidoreductase family protein [Novosphingobium mangrovi (ex Huang et al. 2023)]